MEQVPPLEHLEALARERITAHENVHKQEALAREEAARRVDARLEQLNELRSEVLTDRSRLVTQDAHNADIKAVYAKLDAEISKANTRIDGVDGQLAERRGRDQGLSLGWSIFVGAVGLVATLTAVYLAVVN